MWQETTPKNSAEQTLFVRLNPITEPHAGLYQTLDAVLAADPRLVQMSS